MNAIAQAKAGADLDAIPEVAPQTILAWLEAGDIVLVDVRETVEYEADHIAGALLCPLSTFEAEHFPVFPGKRVVIHCAVGKRSAAACKQLRQVDYPNEVVNMAGGIAAWKDDGCPTEVQTEDRAAIPFIDGVEPGADVPPPLQAGAHPGRVLESEFLKPFGMTGAALAKAIKVPPSRISAIIRGKRRVTAETAMRLARHLCTTDEFWLRLQAAHDLAVAHKAHGAEVDREVKPRRTSARA